MRPVRENPALAGFSTWIPYEYVLKRWTDNFIEAEIAKNAVKASRSRATKQAKLTRSTTTVLTTTPATTNSLAAAAASLAPPITLSASNTTSMTLATATGPQFMGNPQWNMQTMDHVMATGPGPRQDFATQPSVIPVTCCQCASQSA